MYTNFFGLSDTPFSIAPNPDYLFMSERHREALAYLSHGLGETGGFVLLTGEVGTGKTTISRRLLEQLPDNTQVAFILNPTLSCLELLATICDELKIRYKKTGASLKYLTDKIQEKLLKNQAADIDTILIIDEAQHLQPDVLEQLRLLTNLETNTKKLLQVILIGQPELQQLLQRRDLRQLAQRITARYHLLPLTKPEVGQYIEHRISVADCHRKLFSPAAVATVHKISGGIPRIINLLCDRALSLAYGENQSVVDKKLIVLAAQQALGPDYVYQPWWQHSGFKVAMLVLSLGGVAGFSFWYGQRGIDTEALLVNDTPVQSAPVKQAADVTDSVPTKSAETEEAASAAITQLEEPLNVTASDAQQTTAQQLVEQVAQALPEQQVQTIEHYAEVEPQQVVSHEVEPVTFDATKVQGGSESLLAKIQSAVEAENQQASMENDEQGNDFGELPDDVEPLTAKNLAFQNAVPPMQFDMHIYASDGEGFVKVNGRDRYEGDIIAKGVVLERIMPQNVILTFQGQRFTLPALSSW